MAAISIIGTGNMGAAIAQVAAKGGASVQLVVRDTADAQELAASTRASLTSFGEALTGDIVVLATPFHAFDDIVATYGEQLAGKTVVDITNPLDFATFDGLVVPADGSAASVLASKLPGANVLKAFNTNFAATLSTGVVGGAPTTVLVAGDDAAAKAALIEVVTSGGIAAVDAGGLKRARELEAVGFLQLTLAVGEKINWTGGFALNK